MIVAPDVFIGLVTFPRTRFVKARSQEGLAAGLTRWLPECGLSVEMAVQGDDLLNQDFLAVTPDSVRAAIDTELLIEREWREYLSGEKASVAFRSLLVARRMWRRFRWAPPWQRSGSATGARSLIRLANIELAHLGIMDAALSSQARWCVILEDDAQTDDPQSLARQLCQFLAAVESTGLDVTMINLSESFSPQQLGISHLLVPLSPPPSKDWRLFASRRHVTNTVCAVLYRRDFLLALRAQLAAIPLEPVVPIDFKINAAILRSGDALPGQTWVCSPAPIQQASGVPSPAINIAR